MVEFSSIPGVINIVSGEYTLLECERELFESTCFYIKSNINGLWLIDIFAIDYSIDHQNLEIRYLFNVVEANISFVLSLKVNKQDSLKSISHLFKNAGVFEQEIFEFFGLQFDRVYTNSIFHPDNTIKPLLKDELRKPKAKETPDVQEIFQVENRIKKKQLQFILKSRDHLVETCKINMGNYHIGVEKILENLDFAGAYTVLENYFPTTAVEWSFLLSSISEKNMNLAIPDRAKALRMVMLEFSRIYNHLLYLRDLNIYFQSDRLYQQALLWIKRLQSLFISFSGNEYMKNVLRVGGVSRDVNQSWLSRAMDEMVLLEKELAQYYQFTLSNNSWKQMLNVSLIHKSDSADSSLSGPLVRSTGLNIDYRKIAPFYFYSEVDFEIPVATSGTAFDLYCVKVEEIFQSLRIILQVLDNLPTGLCMHEKFLDLSNMKNSQAHFSENEIRNHVDKLFNNENNIENFQFIEGANGLMNLNLILKDSRIYRMRLFSNDLNLKAVFENITRGRDISEIELIWTILNPNLKHIER